MCSVTSDRFILSKVKTFTAILHGSIIAMNSKRYLVTFVSNKVYVCMLILTVMHGKDLWLLTHATHLTLRSANNNKHRKTVNYKINVTTNAFLFNV